MQNEEDLQKRISQLELENSELRDKLDMIYAIVAPEEGVEPDGDDPEGDLVQITGGN